MGFAINGVDNTVPKDTNNVNEYNRFFMTSFNIYVFFVKSIVFFTLL
jgi:hypothetical protein